jgi:hypothetical protein
MDTRTVWSRAISLARWCGVLWVLSAAFGCSQSHEKSSDAGFRQTGGREVSVTLPSAKPVVDSGQNRTPSVEAAGSDNTVNTRDADGEVARICATVSAVAVPEPIYLAFAFDISGSMGKGDKKWHDKTLKWDPVVSALRAFFEDPISAGLNASLTFFPAEGDEDKRCIEEAYATPGVPVTTLPSPVFSNAIAAIEPRSEDDWRGGTPTVWVVRGTLQFIRGYRDSHPGKYAIVLVTDGYPQGCDDAVDSVQAVVPDVQNAQNERVLTYVIGVANPPIDNAPDTVSDLHAIAAAGGTRQAYLIDTGDPERTAQTFNSAVDEIRAVSISCALNIPASPDGRSFEKDKVAVNFTSDRGPLTPLRYDAACTAPNAWHYDSVTSPTQIVLCDSTCHVVQSAVDPRLAVEFTCNSLILL